ncbi:hypothetical protein DL93DRAFT_1423534 [Clavulina sp. PMI_390]|nr:hypothetical protein DL93DRAFT_1423534 [Clavulina sp. PMI_390]
MQGLIIHHSKSSPVSIAVLGESTFSDIYRHCILAADDSPDNVASRVEQMDVMYVTCNAYSQPSVELLDAIVEHKVVAVMTKLMRDIKEDTQRYPAAGPGTEQLWKKWFGRMVTFWLDIMDRGTALRRGEVAEQTVDANLLYLLEWWTVESPQKLFRAFI